LASLLQVFFDMKPVSRGATSVHFAGRVARGPIGGKVPPAGDRDAITAPDLIPARLGSPSERSALFAHVVPLLLILAEILGATHDPVCVQHLL